MTESTSEPADDAADKPPNAKASTRDKKPSSTKKAKRTIEKTRRARPYPASSFEEALPLAEAIHNFASGEKVRRLTLLKQLDKSPTSSATQMLITNSGKYGLTVGSHAAEWLSLTDTGAIASNLKSNARKALAARFSLAIDGVAPFKHLYLRYKGKKLPTHDVIKDALAEGNFPIDNPAECIDTFIVNAKYLGLLQTIAGSETLIPIEQVIDELPEDSSDPTLESDLRVDTLDPAENILEKVGQKVDWSKICFLITPIGDEESEHRRHADLFLGSLLEPALKEFGLKIVRADKIGSAGMITTQILEHVMRSRLAIVDLSYHNPNAFYEMALRHACKLPVVQIIRKADKLPFDVNQVRTVVIDTTDIFSLVPRLETYRSEIASLVRAALNDPQSGSNPISVFFPGFQVVIPKEK